jgi:hypothetical protein
MCSQPANKTASDTFINVRMAVKDCWNWLRRHEPIYLTWKEVTLETIAASSRLRILSEDCVKPDCRNAMLDCLIDSLRVAATTKIKRIDIVDIRFHFNYGGVLFIPAIILPQGKYRHKAPYPRRQSKR